MFKMSNSVGDSDFNTVLILGLKSALFEAQNEAQELRIKVSQVEREALQYYLKCGKTEVMSMNQVSKLSDVIDKQQRELKQLRVEVDERKKIFADKENDNVNLQFKVKELKSLLDTKTELLESLNIKGDKFDKQTLNDYHVKYKSLIKNLKIILRNQQCYPVCELLEDVKTCVYKAENGCNMDMAKYTLKKVKTDKKDALSKRNLDSTTTMIAPAIDLKNEDKRSDSRSSSEDSGIHDTVFSGSDTESADDFHPRKDETLPAAVENKIHIQFSLNGMQFEKILNASPNESEEGVSLPLPASPASLMEEKAVQVQEFRDEEISTQIKINSEEEIHVPIERKELPSLVEEEKGGDCTEAKCWEGERLEESSPIKTKKIEKSETLHTNIVCKRDTLQNGAENFAEKQRHETLRVEHNQKEIDDRKMRRKSNLKESDANTVARKRIKSIFDIGPEYTEHAQAEQLPSVYSVIGSTFEVGHQVPGVRCGSGSGNGNGNSNSNGDSNTGTTSANGDEKKSKTEKCYLSQHRAVFSILQEVEYYRKLLSNVGDFEKFNEEADDESADVTIVLDGEARLGDCKNSFTKDDEETQMKQTMTSSVFKTPLTIAPKLPTKREVGWKVSPAETSQTLPNEDEVNKCADEDSLRWRTSRNTDLDDQENIVIMSSEDAIRTIGKYLSEGWIIDGDNGNCDVNASSANQTCTFAVEEECDVFKILAEIHALREITRERRKCFKEFLREKEPPAPASAVTRNSANLVDRNQSGNVGTASATVPTPLSPINLLPNSANSSSLDRPHHQSLQPSYHSTYCPVVENTPTMLNPREGFNLIQTDYSNADVASLNDEDDESDSEKLVIAEEYNLQTCQDYRNENDSGEQSSNMKVFDSDALPHYRAARLSKSYNLRKVSPSSRQQIHDHALKGTRIKKSVARISNMTESEDFTFEVCSCSSPPQNARTSEGSQESENQLERVKEVETENSSDTSSTTTVTNLVTRKFYVENASINQMPQISLTPFEEIWPLIKVIHINDLPSPEQSQLIACTRPVTHVAFYRKQQKNDKKQNTKMKETVVNSHLFKVKETILTYLRHSVENEAEAAVNFLLSVGLANAATVCEALMAVVMDQAKADINLQKLTARRLVSVCLKLAKTTATADSFTLKLRTALKEKMFTKQWRVDKNSDNNMVSCMIALSRFYTMLCVTESDIAAVKWLIHESLSYLKYRAHPIAFGVLTTYPHVFNEGVNPCLLTKVILFCLVNHSMTWNPLLYKVPEVRELINNYYGVKLGQKAAEDYAKEAMTKFHDETWIDAVALLCKRQEFAWAYTNVVTKYLIHILNKWDECNFNEIILIKAVQILSKIMKSIPSSGSDLENNGATERAQRLQQISHENYNVELIANTLSKLLHSSKGSRNLKETVANAICDMSSIKFELCSRILHEWKPTEGFVSSDLLNKLHKSMISYRTFERWLQFVAPKEYEKRSMKKRASAVAVTAATTGDVAYSFAKRRKVTKKENRNGGNNAQLRDGSSEESEIIEVGVTRLSRPKEETPTNRANMRKKKKNKKKKTKLSTSGVR